MMPAVGEKINQLSIRSGGNLCRRQDVQPMQKRWEQREEENIMGRGLLLWLIGIPIPIILLIWLFGGLH
jgi:hypothetical protein